MGCPSWECRIPEDDEVDSCGWSAWCRPKNPEKDYADDTFDGTCTRYQAEGEPCGGFTPSYFVEKCHLDLGCIDQKPSMMDEPGMCMQPCQTDSDCASSECVVFNQNNGDSFCMQSCEYDESGENNDCGPYNTCMPNNLCHPTCGFGRLYRDMPRQYGL